VARFFCFRNPICFGPRGFCWAGGGTRVAQRQGITQVGGGPTFALTGAGGGIGYRKKMVGGMFFSSFKSRAWRADFFGGIGGPPIRI